MVAFENKDYIRTMPYMSEQRNLASKILAMQWNADSFIYKKKELCCCGNVFKVYGSLNETDLFTIQRGTIKSSDSFYKKPANPLINIFLSNCIIIRFFF